MQIKTTAQLQKWVNDRNKVHKLVIDGAWGPKSREAFIEVFRNKNAKGVTKCQIDEIARELGDPEGKRLRAVAKVESAGFGWNADGMVKILYERHHFYRALNRVISIAGLGYLSKKNGGGYTLDVNNNSINDSWEKLSYAVKYNPEKAVSSVSAGNFQIMLAYYKQCGYYSALDMLYAFSQDEHSHYLALRDYILKVAHIKSQFLQLSGNVEDCVPFVARYNGSGWRHTNPSYPSKLAKFIREAG